MKRLSLVLAALLAACGSSVEPNVSLRIEADPDWLLSENGTRPSSVLRAFLVEDGVRTRIQPTRWTVSDPRVGTIDEEGRFIATGARGGEVILAAELDRQGSTLRAETPMAVRVRRDVLASPGLSAAVITAFEAATPVDDPSTAPFVRHPLDGARMPNDVAPPSIQWDSDWDSGGQQDLIRVTLDSPFAEVRAYLDGGQIDAAWTVDDASWRLLAESAAGQEIELEVARLGRGNTVAPGARVRLSLSARALQLAMVAWELSIDPQRSQLVHVDPTSGERTGMVDLGAIECTGCHAVALDDDQLAATVDRRFTGLYDLTVGGDATITIEPPLDGVAFQPGGSLLVGSRIPEGETTSALYAYDRASGDAVTVPGLPAEASSPAFARDGSWLAYVTGGSDRGTRGRTSIVHAPFTTDRVGTPVTLHDGADLASAPEGGETDSHPSYSPDGSFVAFAHGTASHAVDDASTPARSALYLVSAEGGDPVRLERAMGPEGDGLAFWPVMAPRLTVEADGTRHYWLAFYSRMPYGNDVAGTRGTPRRQLWVAAIDPDREGDPSFAPFRVGGQREDRDQLAGAWQVQACVAEGASCRVDSQCCSGVCGEDGTCGAALACRPLGASCDATSPCCDGLECEAGQCLEVVE